MTEAAPKRAFVLGSGGVLGFAWLLGALSAVQDEAGFDARDAQTVVGTSAGSVAAALLGCGLSVDVITRHHQGIPAADDPDLTYDYIAGVGNALPPRPGWRPASPRLAWAGLRHPRTISPIVALTGLLPPGRGSLAPVHALVETVATISGFSDRWPDAPRPWIVATDHRSGRRVVFGRDDFGSRTGSANGSADGSADGRPRIVRRAALADAVQASCSIPGWYPPTVINGVPYIDGGTVSVASVDVVRHTGADEVFVLAPMASVVPDRPSTAAAKLERRLRRVITRRICADVDRLRALGMRVFLLTPRPEDLTAMGVNMMDSARRTEVLQTARSTAAAQLRDQLDAGRRRAPETRRTPPTATPLADVVAADVVAADVVAADVPPSQAGA